MKLCRDLLLSRNTFFNSFCQSSSLLQTPAAYSNSPPVDRCCILHRIHGCIVLMLQLIENGTVFRAVIPELHHDHVGEASMPAQSPCVRAASCVHPGLSSPEELHPEELPAPPQGPPGLFHQIQIWFPSWENGQGPAPTGSFRTSN